MKRLPGLFCLCLLLAVLFSDQALAQTQPQLGDVALLSTLGATRLAADPTRDRIYALVPANNSVAVIDTTTLAVTATVPIGTNPVDLSISPDAATLYVANSNSEYGAIGSGTDTISVLDLATLQTRAPLTLSAPAYSLAAGLNGRLYVETLTGNGDAIEQVSAATGKVQATFARDVAGPALAISPDGTTLFVSSQDDFGVTTLSSYDVSTATPRALKSGTSTGGRLAHLGVGHQGKQLCVPCDEGNANGQTALFSAADVSTYFGLFDAAGFSPLAFSPDDALLYGVGDNSGHMLGVTDTATFQTRTVALPDFGSSGLFSDVQDVQTDRTGSYVFVSADGSNSTLTIQLVVLTTGAGSLKPAALLPALTVEAAGVGGTVFQPFTYQIKASHSPTSYAAANLPSGLTLDLGTGLISGAYAPTNSSASAATFQVVLTATNAVAIASATLAMTFQPDLQAPVITSALQVSTPVEQPFTYQITAAHGPYHYGATGLPTTLKLDSATGLISGTPVLPGTYPVQLEADNSHGQDTETLTLVVASSGVPAPVITSPLAVSTTQADGQFSYQITATNSPTSFTATGYPGDFVFNPHTGVFSGQPINGVYTVALTASNGGGTASATLTLTVADPVNPPPVITGGTATGQVSQSFLYSPEAGPDAPVAATYTATGLPPGLTIDPAYGDITGTPTQPGTFPVQVQITTVNGSAQATITIQIDPNLPYVTVDNTGVLADIGDGTPAVFQVHLDRTLPANLVIYYTLKGTAANGMDYQLLKGHKRVKAGKNLAYINVKPLGDLGGAPKKTVKLTLTTDPGYLLGEDTASRVKIVGPGFQ